MSIFRRGQSTERQKAFLDTSTDIVFDNLDETEHRRQMTSQYFGDGGNSQENEGNERKSNYNQNQKEMFEGFNWTYYIEFVIYHMLFFYLLGPFTTLVLGPFTGTNLMKNLFFWRWHKAFLYQCSLWVLNMGGYFVTQYYYNDPLFEVQLILILSTTFIRVLTVSAKYGTFSKAKMLKWRTVVVPIEELVSEFVLAHWNDQQEDFVEKEIKKSLQKKEIDSAIFHVNFLSDVDPKLAEQLRLNTNTYKERTNSYIPMRSIQRQSEVGSEKYHGYSIFRYFIDQFKGTYKSKNFYWLFPISLLRAMFPLLLSIPGGTIHNKSVYWWITEVICIYINTVYFLVSGSLLGVHLKDCHRKVFFMEQLSYLIAPRRFDGFSGKKLFPTINILDAMNLKSWISMRKMAMEYGSRIDYRLQIDLATCLLYYITIILLIALDKITIPALNSSIPFGGSLVIFFEASVMICLAFSPLLKGAKINKFYQIHKQILMENRIFYLDIMRKSRLYLGDDPIKPKNYLYRFSIRNFIRCDCEDTTVKGIEVHLRLLHSITEEIMDDLDFDQKAHPFKVFGIAITYELISTLAIGLLSAGASAASTFLNKQSS